MVRGYILLRLPHEVKEIFSDWLRAHYPLKAAHVLSLVRQTHGGKLYESEFGTRMKGKGAYAELLERRFATACRRLGLQRKGGAPLDVSRFRVPPRPGDQPGLFDREAPGRDPAP